MLQPVTLPTPPSPAWASQPLDRRSVLGGAAALAASASLAGRLAADPPGSPAQPGAQPSAAAPAATPAAMPRRPFGKTGLEASLFGLGCFPIGGLPDEDEGVRLVRLALDLGCTYLDTAPSYGEGRSERRVGLAIKGRPREGFLLATKTHTRTEREARNDLEKSLERLGVQHIDLVQVHAVGDSADMERALAKDGPLRALEKARDEKLVRFIGVTGHRDPAVMATCIERYAFDSLLFPLNCVDPHHHSFVAGTLPQAVKNGLARVAMKVFASGKLPTLGIEAADCLRFTYGLDISTAIVGCSSEAQVRLAAEVACQSRRLSPGEQARLVDSTQPHRGSGTEWYKPRD